MMPKIESSPRIDTADLLKYSKSNSKIVSSPLRAIITDDELSLRHPIEEGDEELSAISNYEEPRQDYYCENSSE
jgi:hypothetical protein